MPKRGERYHSAWFEVDIDDETGELFWRGGGAGDKDETRFDRGEPLSMDPRHFPVGTRIDVTEPWDEEFYERLLDRRGEPDEPPPGVETQYVLVRDDDGHWYVCPADKRREADAYFEAMGAFWGPHGDADGPEPERPGWLEDVGGAPSLVRFTGYTID